jgi:hypothetical protein
VSGLGANGNVELWTKPLSSTEIAAFALNTGDHETTAMVGLSDMGITSTKAHARDIWARKDLGNVELGVNVRLGVHDSAFFIFSPST